MATQRTIALGDHVGIPVVPQRHARLRNMLSGADLAKIASGDYASESYRVLSVLIPVLPNAIPLWEWEGYGSQEAMDNGTYEEHLDKSPTTAQIVDAFEAAIMVSGADRLGKIMGLVQTVENLNQTETPTPSSLPSAGSTGE